MLLEILVGVAFAADPAPKYGPAAERMFDAREYIRKSDAPDFWALIPYYVSQEGSSACSIASATMALNGLRSRRTLTAADELATQSGVLKKSGNREWSRAVGSLGRGLTLDQLAKFTEKAAHAYGINDVRAEVVRFENTSATELARLRSILEENEKSSNDLILLNFLQSVYTGDAEGAVGHIAPLAAYDAKRRRVLVLDPDRQFYEPYWVSDEVALSGMVTRDSVSGKHRGLVWLKPATR